MSTLAAGQILWHVTLLHTLHSQSCQNGFYFTNKNELDDSPSILGPYAVTVANTFFNSVYPIMKAFQNQEVHYKSIVVSTLIPHEGPVAELNVDVGEGAQPDESLPSYCAAILTLRTGQSGKSNRGRLYIAGVSENDTSAGQLIPSAFTALEDIGNELLTRFGPGGFDANLRYIVFSKKHGYSSGGVWSAAGMRYVSQIVPRRTLGTCRHRLIGKGN